jgi:hypothetical protein
LKFGVSRKGGLLSLASGIFSIYQKLLGGAKGFLGAGMEVRYNEIKNLRGNYRNELFAASLAIIAEKDTIRQNKE